MVACAAGVRRDADEADEAGGVGRGWQVALVLSRLVSFDFVRMFPSPGCIERARMPRETFCSSREDGRSLCERSTYGYYCRPDIPNFWSGS